MEENSSATIVLGYKCNNNCIFCLYGEREDNLKLNEIKAALRELRKKTSTIMLTGGSAYRKDFLKILRYASNLGFKLHIDTNGRIFSDKEFTKKVFDASSKPLVFSISLHSSYPRIHEKITRVKDSWHQTVQGIKNVAELGGYVIIPTVICKLNYKELPRIAKFVKSLGAKEWHPILVRKEGRAERIYRKLIVPISEIQPYLLKALKESIKIAVTGFPLCTLPSPEYSYEIRALKSKEIVWYKDGKYEDELKSRINRKIKLTSCKDCKYFFMCEGILLEYFERYGAKEFKPVKS